MKTLQTLLSTALLLGASASATTIIVGLGNSGSNTQIPSNYASNISASVTDRFEVTDGGTPDIALTWSSVNGSTVRGWEFHNWMTGANDVVNGVLQLDGSSVGSTFSITFTPTAGKAVVLNGFNFVGDTNGDSYQYQVDIVRLSNNAITAIGTTPLWTTNLAQNPGTNGTFAGAPIIDLNFTGNVGEAYRLDLVRIGGVNSVGSAVDIAIDNLSFSQIPEPSSTALLGLAACGLIVRRRRSN